MGLATHLGPWLVGTVKNPSNTSATISSSGLGTSANTGTYRNTGATLAMQTSPGGILYTNTSATTLTTPGNVVQAVGGTSSTTLTLTGTTAAAEGIALGMTVVGPGIAAGTTITAASGSAITLSTAVTTSATSPAPFLFYVNTTTNVDPLVLPAGSVITSVYVDVLTAFNAGTNNTISLQLLNSTATYTFASLVATGASIAVGRYSLGSIPSATIAFSSTAIGSMLMTNISSGQNIPTDAILQATFAGTGTAASAGMASVTVTYAVCNSDGTYFPQIPGSAVVANY